MKDNSKLSNCNLCSKSCKIDRYSSIGFCKSNENIKIARAELHFWEEPCISGSDGSGTIFFSNCNLRCVFCQNHLISQSGAGVEISIVRLSEIFLELQEKKANNINLVTPTHYVPQIIESIKLARNNGLTIPIVYNSNGYDSIDTIKMLNGYIDVYLPDFKYFNDKYAVKYSSAPNYANNALAVIKEMFNQVGNPIFNDGIMIKGVIVRHLMLPGLLFDSKKVIDTLYSNFGDNIYISFMNQYTPLYEAELYPEINKPLNPKMYNSLIDYAVNLGVKNGFIQDDGTSCESYVPSFNLEGVKK